MSEHDAIQTVMGRLERYLKDLDQIPRRAHQRYRAYKPEDLTELGLRSEASCIHDHMLWEAERLFANRPDVRPVEIRGLKLWLLGDHSVVRFKKMDEDGKSRSTPTRQARAFDGGLQLEGLPPLPTRLCVGYLLTATGLDVVRVQVSHPNGRGIDWCAAIIPVGESGSPACAWEDVTRQRGFGT